MSEVGHSLSVVPELDRIEETIRTTGAPPAGSELVVRGGPLAAAKLVEHAVRQQRSYSYRGLPMASISVSATVDGWTIESLLAGPLVTRTSYATCTVGALLQAGYELLATGPAPHFDIVLVEASLDECERLLAHFAAALDNPFKRRR